MLPLPTGPTASLVVVLGLIGAALYLFFKEPLPVDITAIGLLVATILLEPWTKVSTQEGFSGFANPAVLTILAMFILSDGVRRTGLLNKITSFLFGLTGSDYGKQLAATIGFAGPASAFVNNTPIVAMMIPVLNDMAEKSNYAASRLLMPLSYAAIAGGLLTLIGSSSNLLASDIAARYTRPFTMFEFTGLGIIVLVVTAVYLLTIGRRLLPDHGETTAFQQYDVDEYLTEVIVEEDAHYIGETIGQFLEDSQLDIDVVKIIRDGTSHLQPFSHLTIQKGDIMVVRAQEDNLLEILQDKGISLIPEKGRDHLQIEEEGGFSLARTIIMPGSSLIGESLISSSFRQKYDASVLAIRRKGETITKRLNSIHFRPGDTLLLQTTEDTIEKLVNDTDLAVAEGAEKLDYNTSKMPLAAGIMAGVIALAALDILPIVVSAFAGVIAMIVTRCIKPRHIYKAVNWQVIFLLAGVIPLGIALENSGAAQFFADGLLASSSFLPPLAILTIVYLVSNLLANTIDANAAVILMGPIAMTVAQSMGANPLSFILAVTFGVGTAFMTPIGYQTNLMVYGPGHYSFSDYLKVGGPLQLILTVVIVLGIYQFWGI
jgi:di/tricarboxylate transporter